LVVAMPLEAVPQLIRSFPPPDYYLSEQGILDALRQRSMFNLLCLTDGEKVDFWMLSDAPFDQARFARKRIEQVLGLSLMVSSPEDTILAKLRWSKLSGGSEKQFTDALRVYEVQQQNLALGYLAHWANQLAVEELWKRLCDEAEPA